jgi:cyclopropane-fatty-acyl-phospholipid synthase
MAMAGDPDTGDFDGETVTPPTADRLTVVRDTGLPPGASAGGPAAGASVAATLRPLLERFVSLDGPVRFMFWDGSTLGAGASESVGTVEIRSADAVRRLVWSPNQLGLGRAFVSGDIVVHGDVFPLLRALVAGVASESRFDPRIALTAVRTAQRIGALGRPVPPPLVEMKPKGWRHTRRRDAAAIAHHYDVSNEFYKLLLGPSLTYSCARYGRGDMTLAEAQADKHELICRKLGLHEHRGRRLLDVGCGWASLAIHAAEHHGAQVVGITISKAQAELARQRVAERGLDAQIEVRLQDYRDLGGETFDAISSVGMFEHVGKAQLGRYFSTLRSLLGPYGRLLNHGISTPEGSKLGRREFAYRYVFPDGEMLDVGDVVLAMEVAGFEVRDVEGLREHYARTLRDWITNLETHWDQAVAEVGVERARVWLVFMAASSLGFEFAEMGLHQVLGVVPDGAGFSHLPPTRSGWTTPADAAF